MQKTISPPIILIGQINLGTNRAELKTHVNRRDKNQMNRTARETFGLDLESHTDDTFKRKKQT
jgi:hypothetical protein